MSKLVIAAAFLTLVAACKTPGAGENSQLRDASAAPSDAPCQGKVVLVVTSASDVITLQDGSRYPTGYFLRELTDPLIPLIRAGCAFEFATPGGRAPVVDSNSLELLWAYHPYNDQKAVAPQRRRDAVKLAETAYGKLRFSVENEEKWQRLTDEVKAFVSGVQADEESRGLSEIAPRSLDDVAAELAARDAASLPSPYVAMLVPGGHVPMEDLKVEPALGKVLNYFHAHRVPTSLVCHAPVALLATTQVGPMTYAGYRVAVADRVAEQLLEQVGPLQGYRVRSYVDDDLEAGGVTLSQNPWPGYPHVVADREVITAQNPASAPFLGAMLVESIQLFLQKNGADQWWEPRKLYVTNASIQAEQNAAMVLEKNLMNDAIKVSGDATRLKRYMLKLVGLGNVEPSNPFNVFTSPTGLAAFDASEKAARAKSTLAFYPAGGDPTTELYRFPIPLIKFNKTLNPFALVQTLHNYYFPPIDGFYDGDVATLAATLKNAITATSAGSPGVGEAQP